MTTKKAKLKPKMPRDQILKPFNIEELKQSYLDSAIYGQFLPIDSLTKKSALNEMKVGGVKLYNNNLNVIIDEDPNDKDTNAMCCDFLFSRRCRKKVLALIVALICFLFGVIVTVMFKELLKESKSGPNHFNNHPIMHFNERHKSGPRTNQSMKTNPNIDGVLKDLFISVKTTKRYHHPRLVILLETWASLVASQVRTTYM